MCIHFLDNLPDRFGVCQAYKSAARSQCAWQCADRTNSWRSVMFSYTFWGAHWACTLNILQFQGPKRSCECEAILVGFGLHVELFLQTDPWEPSFCKSTHEKHPPAWKKNLMPFWPLSSSNQIWLHKDMRGNYGLHSPCQQLGSWCHVPISNFPHQRTCVWF